jgi:hypothetical protein
MLFDIANREAGGGQFSGRRQPRNSTADDENVQDFYIAIMPQRMQGTV